MKLQSLLQKGVISIKGRIYLRDIVIPGIYSIPYDRIVMDGNKHVLEFMFSDEETYVEVMEGVPEWIRRFLMDLKIREIHIGINTLRRGKKIGRSVFMARPYEFARMRRSIHLIFEAPYYGLYRYAFYAFAYPTKISFK